MGRWDELQGINRFWFEIVLQPEPLIRSEREGSSDGLRLVLLGAIAQAGDLQGLPAQPNWNGRVYSQAGRARHLVDDVESERAGLDVCCKGLSSNLVYI